jgi:UDP-glucose 4-epimerase
MLGDKIVIIGGSGFIGSHTADELSNQGYRVTIFDKKESPWIRKDQVMVVGDVLDKSAVLEALKGASIVYYFAGISDLHESSINPFNTINLNVMGVTVALDASIKANIKQFVYASTMYVYSHQGSFYRASKQASELIVKSYADEFDLGYVMLRYGSIYGPRAQDWNGISGYVRQILNEKKLDYWGNGKEKREYIHVSDAARLSVQVLDKEHRNTAITVTGSQTMTADELIIMIFEILDLEKNVNFLSSVNDTGHYTITPYRYTPQSAKKIIPSEFIDLGQGILDIIEDISYTE